MLSFRLVEPSEIDKFKDEAQILLVTATDIETQSLHEILKPLPTLRKCAKIVHGNQTYFVGRIGNYGVVHTQCRMGSISAGASMTTVSEAIQTWNFRAVVMVGIAFGIDSKKQRIGDVLVSRCVCPYDSKKVGKKETVQRSPTPPCGPVLLNRFSNSKDWRFTTPKGYQVRLEVGDLLTGESLIDNPVFLRKLLKHYPNACGGEMEGIGVATAANSHGIQWILVKGICDFADGNKAHRKRERQLLASIAAVSVCQHVFSQTKAFDALNCKEISRAAKAKFKPTSKSTLTENQILFAAYRPDCSDAYHPRKSDQVLLTRLKRQGVWVTGPSGCGKTSAIFRALYGCSNDYHMIDLSPCVGSSPTDIFRAIYSEVCEKMGTRPINFGCSDWQQYDYIKAISKTLETSPDKDLYFLIDEIPISSQEDFALFSNGIAAIIVNLGNKGMHRIRFVLASINNPKSSLRNNLSKIAQQIQFFEMPMWHREELTALLKLVLKLLGISMPKPDMEKCVGAANGSPRRLKGLVRVWLMFRESSEWSMDRIILESSDL